jgi:CheY-like chemotaxis protein
VRAADPGAALEQCRALAPDLVILDLHASGALDLARSLEADAATRAIPLVGFYSHVDQALREAALAAGVDRVLPRSAFTAKLAEILAGG